MILKTVRLRIVDLGFPTGALTREIIGSDQDRDLFGLPAPFSGGRISQLGLDLCPPDVGPQLRLQYDDQPRGERVFIGMQPIADSEGEPRIFVVEHSEQGLSLGAVRARSTDEWAADAYFVFLPRRSDS